MALCLRKINVVTPSITLKNATLSASCGLSECSYAERRIFYCHDECCYAEYGVLSMKYRVL
jgi:hypothetical protein